MIKEGTDGLLKWEWERFFQINKRIDKDLKVSAINNEEDIVILK